MELNEMVDDWGRVVLDDNSLLEFMYRDLGNVGEIFVEDSPAVQEYNKWCQVFDYPELTANQAPVLTETPAAFHTRKQNEWLMPSEYLELDIRGWLLDRCKTQIEVDRVNMELGRYEALNMMNILRLFVYVTTELRANEVLWGVGRGSSVASYCLYLIGINRINSIKYDLDVMEFLR